MRIPQEFSAWGNKLDLSAVPDHLAALWFREVLALNFTIVVHTIVISTQRGQIRRIRLPTILMRN